MQNKNNNINDILKYYNINIKDYNNLLDNCDFIREHIQNICSNLSQYIKQVNIKQTIRDLTMYCSNISGKIGSCLHEVFPNNEICKTVANKSINITLLNNIVGNTYIKDKEVVTFQQFLNYLSNKICLVVMQCAYNIENLIKNKNIDEKVIKNEIKLCCENVTNILDKLKTIPFGKQLIDVILYYDN